jgi:hypothetical protein
VLENFQFHSVFDNSAAKEDLGFRYTITLREGLPRWYQSLEQEGRIENSDDDPLEDRIIATWRRLVDAAAVSDVAADDHG